MFVRLERDSPGEVPVQMESSLGNPVSNTVTFEYIDENAINIEVIQNLPAEKLKEALIEVLKMVTLNSKKGTSPPGKYFLTIITSKQF